MDSDPANAEIIEVKVKVPHKDSFKQHYIKKMDQVLNIDNRTKMTDAEIANCEEEFF